MFVFFPNNVNFFSNIVGPGASSRCGNKSRSTFCVLMVKAFSNMARLADAGEGSSSATDAIPEG
ncbi:hypothetical protein BN1723_003846 [Verticillium longisporum]|nr:hypothetical protein BN1723_003846 [Verticillium longisporum]